MSPGESPLILSEWYELVASDQLMQGDIFEGCPVFRPPSDLKWPIQEESEEFEFALGTQDVMVMTQSCDLLPDQKSGMWLVILCPIWKLSEASRENQILASSYGKEECRRGHMTGYHMIAGCEHGDWNREISIVSFREVWSLPLDFVRRMAAAYGPRPRLRPPYREHLAQAFARYFMRVGLPVDIPAFKSVKAESELLKKLNALDAETRQRLLSHFA
jgi:hypothetical protein